MAESDQEIRTRGERDAAIKESTLEFNKLARSVNRVIQEINFASVRPNVEVDELVHYSERYKSTLIELSSLYDRICELSLDCTPPPKVVEVFERIDSEGCKISADISSLVREISSKEKLVKSDSNERSSINELTRAQAEQAETMEKLCSQLVLGRLPSPEPEVFSGDPLDFTAWYNSFKTLVTTRSIPESERIFYLSKYLSGEAKECVKGYLSLCTSNAYFAALETLKERFGSDFVVANAFRQKLRKWPRIQNDDFVGLRKFSDYLAQVETAKESNRSLSVLDDEQENRALLLNT